MIDDVVRILQRIACIWLALSVLYPIANNTIMASVQRNHPRDYYDDHIVPSKHLMPSALAVLTLTITDMLISLVS